MEEQPKKSNETSSRDHSTHEVIEENLRVGKRKVITGTVTLNKKVLEEEIPLDFKGIREEVHVEVKKIGKIVDEPGPAVREEGDSTVYSVYREKYIKQTILEEEVWVTKKQHEVNYESPQKLRREVIDIERSRDRSNE